MRIAARRPTVPFACLLFLLRIMFALPRGDFGLIGQSLTPAL
jgi:hypothetical protein